MNKNAFFLIFLGILFHSALTYSQDTLKSLNNKWSVELFFNPFNNDLTFNNAVNQIKFRHFSKDGIAWRYAVNLSYNLNKTNSGTAYGSNPYSYEVNQQSFLIGINIGKEKHFKGTRRLSPYIGWESGVSYKVSKQKSTVNDITTEISGAWTTYVPTSQQVYYEKFTEEGYWSVGANIISGFDFYISEKFYLEYEILFGLEYFNYADLNMTESYGSPSQYASPEIDKKTLKFEPKLMNGIRIGYFF